MNVFSTLTVVAWRLYSDRRAQDMVEYSLAAAFVAVTASALFPPAIAPAICGIFSRVVEILPEMP